MNKKAEKERNPFQLLLHFKYLETLKKQCFAHISYAWSVQTLTSSPPAPNASWHRYVSVVWEDVHPIY